MNKYLVAFIIISLSFNLFAQKNDNYGTEISYKDLGNDSFLVTVVSYTDCDLCSYGQCGVKSIALRGPVGCSRGVTIQLKHIENKQLQLSLDDTVSKNIYLYNSLLTLRTSWKAKINFSLQASSFSRLRMQI